MTPGDSEIKINPTNDLSDNGLANVINVKIVVDGNAEISDIRMLACNEQGRVL